MIYLLLFLFGASILLYVTSRWLSAEARGFGRWAREHWILARGGQSPERLIQTTRRAFTAEGLEPDFIVVAHQALPCYERLRRDYLGQVPEQPLPAGVVLALAADVDAGQVFVRAVVAQPGIPGREEAAFLRFDQVRSAELIPARLPEGVAPAADQALELVTTDANLPPLHLALEPEWGVDPKEIADRIRALLAGRWRPDAPPAIVR